MTFLSPAKQQELMQQTGYAGYAPAPAAPQPDYWRPAALDRPPVSYPAYSFDTADGKKERKPYRGSFVDRYIASGRGVNSTAGSITPGSPAGAAGPGAYIGPGTHAADQQWQQQTANLMATRDPYIMANRRLGSLSANGGGYGGGGYGGGGGGYNNPEGLAKEYQQALDRANQENEARYQDINAGRWNTRDWAMNRLQGAASQERADINQAYDASGAAMRQGLVGRGLGNSTVLDTMQMGNQRERQNALGRLNDRMTQQELAAYTSLTDEGLDFMERRTDQAPDLNQLIQLSQLMGQGNVGNGGAGGGAYMAGPPIYESPAQVGYQIPRVGSVAMMGGGNVPMTIAGLAGGPGAHTIKDRDAWRALKAKMAADALLGGPVMG